MSAPISIGGRRSVRETVQALAGELPSDVPAPEKRESHRTAAAKACGMPLATFRYRVEIYEKSAK